MFKSFCPCLTVYTLSNSYSHASMFEKLQHSKNTLKTWINLQKITHVAFSQKSAADIGLLPCRYVKKQKKSLNKSQFRSILSVFCV